jgi:hypothetical protein
MRFSPKLFLVSFFPLLFVFVTSPRSTESPGETAGVKLTVRNTSYGMTTERTQYFQKDRKRLEYQSMSGGAKRADGSMDLYYGPHIASITRCDLGKSYELNLDAREYHTFPYPPKPFTIEETKTKGLKPVGDQPATPTMLIEITTQDTGERKEMFGHTARHVIRTRKETPLEGSRAQAQQTVEDGWFIDLDTAISCDRKWNENQGADTHVVWLIRAGSAPPELPRIVEVGKPEAGFVVKLNTTYRGAYALPDGTKKESTVTSETTVTLLEEGPLAPAIFEVPPGFGEVAKIDASPHVPLQAAGINAWAQFKARVGRLFN